MSSQSAKRDLLLLMRSFGDPANDLVILAEGNASSRIDDQAFWVKASGKSMRDIGPDDVLAVQIVPVLDAMRSFAPSDEFVKQVLRDSKLEESSSQMPSVETFMHAALLSLQGINVVGHTHPTPLVSLLCHPNCAEMATQRLFPDEVVCCGPETCYVEYCDPGVPLANAVRRKAEAYMKTYGEPPKTIWLQNHGLVCLGSSAKQVEAATMMATKAAKIWLGVLATGKKPVLLSQQAIARIHERPDEHYRQRELAKS